MTFNKIFIFLFQLFLHLVDLQWVCLNGQILRNVSSSIRLNLFDIGIEICKPSLIIYTICIRVNFGKVQRIFFCVIYRSWHEQARKLWNHKIYCFCEQSEWWGWWWGVEFKFRTFEMTRGLPKLNLCKQGGRRVQILGIFVITK